MFQSFESRTTPATGAERLARLRAELGREGLAGFLVPRGDAHLAENVAPCDERLAWLTGFTGSAGTCAVLGAEAGLLVDGRYTLQARAETDPAAFGVVPGHEVRLADWLVERLGRGAILGFDPWLHGAEEIAALKERLDPAGVVLRAVANPIDRIWTGRPPAPAALAFVQPAELAGEAHEAKIARLAAELGAAGLAAAVLTQPDAVAWLLNLRGADTARMPVVQAFALLHADGHVNLFADPAKFCPEVRAHLGNAVTVEPRARFEPALADLGGKKVAADRATAPVRVSAALEAAGATVVWRQDPCVLPRALKNRAELAGARAAHRRDGAAMARFLHWLDETAPGGRLTEIDVATRLEAFRAETGLLRDLAFDTICGAGPNGAIVHYHVTRTTNRTVRAGELLLVDSGAQYLDGTTDVTRTVAIGPAGAEEARVFTLVLKGMIAVATARFPKGIGGRDLDSLARAALWRAGLDYDHGTGHGVGAFLGVHEGPAGISRRYTQPFEPGMIVSDEPGYYREGAFGIRIENLLAVTGAEVPAGGERPMLGFETLTLVPIDRRLVRADLLTREERDWLDAYHARVRAGIAPLVPAEVAVWLDAACAPL